MTSIHKTFSFLRTALVASSAIFFLSRCQDQEMETVTQNADAAIAATSTESNVGSLTISGTHTQFTASVDCKTCTFVVADNLQTIDGKELGLKPGSVICLDAALKYGNLSFENLEGTAEQPIIIGNCGK
jgi:hypothetical protein